MPSAFAALEARVNSAVIARLSNRLVTVASLGLQFEGVYEAAGVEDLDGLVETTQPRLTVSLADAPELARETQVVVLNPATLESKTLLVTGSNPDGAGFMVYALREA